MRESRAPLAVLFVFCAVAGTLAGWLSGPALSRANYVVQLAEDVHAAETDREREPGLRAEAARIQGVPATLVFTQAAEIRDRFRVGGALFGLWCGAVVALTFIRARRERRPDIWEPDPAHCVACGRCYLACPLERERLKPHER